MGLRIERIPTLNDNYTYLVVCEATGDAAVIDAPEVDPVVSRVESEGARVTKLLTTHHHADHCGANPALAKLYGVPVFGHISDAHLIPGFTDGLEEGDTVQVGQQSARILHVPAHTSGHVAYVFDEAKVRLTAGTNYGSRGEGHLRMGIATSEVIIKEALDRITEALSKL